MSSDEQMRRDIEKSINTTKFYLMNEHGMTADQITEMLDEFSIRHYERHWDQLGPGDRLVICNDVKKEVDEDKGWLS
jgi:hypothetical protein